MSQKREKLVADSQLRKKSVDREKSRSLLESAQINMQAVRSVPITEETAILVFRETYESIRQLGDAWWSLQGYEPRTHEVSWEAFSEMGIEAYHVSRFKNIRNDLNYRGFKVTKDQATEIVEFWKVYAQKIIQKLQEQLKML